MADLSDALDVDQAARRLGVSRPEMYRLIGSGAIGAQKFANRWVVPVGALRRAELAPRPVGRPFSVTAAWALLRLASRLNAPGLSASRRSQLRRHLSDGDSRELAGRLRGRARRRSLFAHPLGLPRLLADPRLVPSGGRRWRRSAPTSSWPADPSRATCPPGIWTGSSATTR